MRTATKLVACLPFLVPLTTSAEEGRTFPPLPAIQLPGGAELRISTTKRGLSMLPTTPPPQPKPRITKSFGIGGGGYAAPAPAVDHQDVDDAVNDDRGTRVRRKQGLNGDAAQAQETFAALFPKSDPRPTDRTTHFDWLPHYEGFPVQNLGWEAVVQKVEPDHDDAWVITVRMHPRLRSTALKTHIYDYVQETYRLRDGKFRLIDSDAETPKPQYQGFPAAL